MQSYKNKKELIDEINKQADLFINEFVDIKDQYLLINDIDKTPFQMLAYQLGWMNLILKWENEEQLGNKVITPSENYKWNQLGLLYQSFYEDYKNFDLKIMIQKFNQVKMNIINLIENYTEEELFTSNKRNWASSTPSKWPIWKWIHINTVAPFKSFRTKIRKYKKLLK